MARTETGWMWVSKLVTGYFREGPGYACWRSGGTTDWLLTYTIAGLGRYGHSLGDHIARPGQLVLLRPQILHDYGVEATQQSWEFVWAHFHPRPDWLQLLTWSEEAPGLMVLDLAQSTYRQKIAQRFIEAHEHATLSGPRADDLAMNALEEVLLWCAIAMPGAHAALDARVTLAMNHCCRNLADDITLRSLAAVCEISPSRLSFLFLNQVGLPPMRWLEHQRIARAKDLLEVTSEPVHVIGEQVGFHDAFYFSARFRKALGTSPRAWRTAAQARRANHPPTP